MENPVILVYGGLLIKTLVAREKPQRTGEMLNLCGITILLFELKILVNIVILKFIAVDCSVLDLLLLRLW